MRTRVVGVLKCGAGEVSRHCAVLRRDLAEVITAYQTGGAIHVLHDDSGSAVEVLTDVTRKNTRLDVRRPARRIVDQYGKSLALIELGLRLCRRAGKQ